MFLLSYNFSLSFESLTLFSVQTLYECTLCLQEQQSGTSISSGLLEADLEPHLAAFTVCNVVFYYALIIRMIQLL